MHWIKDAFASLRTTWSVFAERQGPLMAAGVAFYAFLSLFPALIASLYFYALFASSNSIAHDTQAIGRLLPSDAARLLTGQVSQITSASRASLGTGAVIATVLALYAASGAINNLLAAINLMQGHSRRRHFLVRRAIALALTAGAILVVTITFALLTIVPIIQDHLGLSSSAHATAALLRWLALVALVGTAIAILFRIAPEISAGQRTRLRFWTPAVLVATTGWLCASLGFSSYVNTFGRYSATYGALAGVVVLMLWLWLGTLVVLFAATLERRR